MYRMEWSQIVKELLSEGFDLHPGECRWCNSQCPHVMCFDGKHIKNKMVGECCYDLVLDCDLAIESDKS